jgi:hypothetical protein
MQRGRQAADGINQLPNRQGQAQNQQQQAQWQNQQQQQAASAARRRTRERKAWAPPPAPGLTLRQRVEQREREEGLRCDDHSCGLGPSDEDPVPVEPMQDLVSLGACDHKFHPSCLVTSERVSGWDGDAKEGNGPVHVPCPCCRTQGSIARSKWNEGVRANL